MTAARAPTIASTIRRSPRSSPWISSTIFPREITTTRSQSPASSSGSLDLTTIATPSCAFVAQRVVDVEAGADVDALRRLLGEDHADVSAQEGAGQRDLLLVAARKRLHGLLDRGHANAQALRDVVDRAPLAPAVQQAEAPEPPQDLDRRVRPHAEDGEEGFPGSGRR